MRYVIYRVTNQVNGKIYIGKTSNFEKRKREHLYDIDDGLPFHSALIKYGIENFIWEIIDESQDEDEINQKEIFWIKELNSCIHFPNSNGYNITLGGEGGTSWNSSPVVQFDLNGNYIEQFPSSSAASYHTGADRKGISDCASGKQKISGGYQWRYRDECDSKHIEPYRKPESSRNKAVVQIGLNGEYINRFPSISKASESTGINRTGIVSCVTGRAELAGKYQWVYESDYSEDYDYKYKGIREGNGIVQLNDNKEILNRYRNCAEAARALGLPDKAHKQIHKNLNAKKRCKGFYWMKYDSYMEQNKEIPR